MRVARVQSIPPMLHMYIFSGVLACSPQIPYRKTIRSCTSPCRVVRILQDPSISSNRIKPAAGTMATIVAIAKVVHGAVRFISSLICFCFCFCFGSPAGFAIVFSRLTLGIGDVRWEGKEGEIDIEDPSLSCPVMRSFPGGCVVCPAETVDDPDLALALLSSCPPSSSLLPLSPSSLVADRPSINYIAYINVPPPLRLLILLPLPLLGD